MGKDVISFFEIKNKNAFNHLLRLLAAQNGQLVKVEELATNLGIDRNTADKYISALEETFIIKKIRHYFNNPRQKIVKAGKIYFMDMGIRNLMFENFSSFEGRYDRGEVLENSVFIELFSKLKHQI